MPDALALIPARGGSKGVPGKNKRPVLGKPLIAWSIEAALGCRDIVDIVVSTDDNDIAAIALNYGVMVNHRPVALAQDDTPIAPVVAHVLDELRQHMNAVYDTIALLQPTSPLRQPADIAAAIHEFRHNGRTSTVCSVYKVEDSHPARMYHIAGDRLAPLLPELASMRRQELPAVYHRNGALYVFGPDAAKSGEIIHPGMLPYVMPAETSINIDAEIDLIYLEAYLRQRACAS